MEYYDDVRYEEELFYEMKSNLYNDYCNGVSIDKIKCCYDEHVIKNSLLTTVLKGFTPDDYFMKYLLPDFVERKACYDFTDQCELDEIRKCEGSPAYAFECLYSTVSNIISWNVDHAKVVYDAQISQYLLFIPDGVSTNADFDKLVELYAEAKTNEVS